MARNLKFKTGVPEIDKLMSEGIPFDKYKNFEPVAGRGMGKSNFVENLKKKVTLNFEGIKPKFNKSK